MTDERRTDRGFDHDVATRNDPAETGEPENVGARGNEQLAGDFRTPRPAYDPGDNLDAGAFIGHEPERAAETIPGGVQPGDERIAANSSQSSGEGGAEHRLQPQDVQGHREGTKAGDSQVREAGENR